MAPRKYTISDKINVLSRLRAKDNNILKTSRELGIDQQCIERWVAQEYNILILYDIVCVEKIVSF